MGVMELGFHQPPFFYILVGLLFVGFILRGRWGRHKQKSSSTLFNGTSYGLINRRELRKTIIKDSVPLDLTVSVADMEKLAPPFEFDGDFWDPYEVLQLSPEVTFSELKEAYQRELQNVDSDSQEFVHQAYQQLKKSHFFYSDIEQ